MWRRGCVALCSVRVPHGELKALCHAGCSTRGQQGGQRRVPPRCLEVQRRRGWGLSPGTCICSSARLVNPLLVLLTPTHPRDASPSAPPVKGAQTLWENCPLCQAGQGEVAEGREPGPCVLLAGGMVRMGTGAALPIWGHRGTRSWGWCSSRPGAPHSQPAAHGQRAECCSGVAAASSCSGSQEAVMGELSAARQRGGAGTAILGSPRRPSCRAHCSTEPELQQGPERCPG